MKVLIDAEADVNIATTKLMLVITVRYGHAETVKALVDAGANVNPSSFLNSLINPLLEAVLHKILNALKC